MQISQEDYILGLWLIASPNDYWLCLAIRRSNQWLIRSKSRYVRRPGADQLTNWSAPGSKSEEAIKRLIDKVAFTLVSHSRFGNHLSYLEIKGGIDEFVKQAYLIPGLRIIGDDQERRGQ